VHLRPVCSSWSSAAAVLPSFREIVSQRYLFATIATRRAALFTISRLVLYQALVHGHPSLERNNAPPGIFVPFATLRLFGLTLRCR